MILAQTFGPTHSARMCDVTQLAKAAKPTESGSQCFHKKFQVGLELCRNLHIGTFFASKLEPRPAAAYHSGKIGILQHLAVH